MASTPIARRNRHDTELIRTESSSAFGWAPLPVNARRLPCAEMTKRCRPRSDNRVRSEHVVVRQCRRIGGGRAKCSRNQAGQMPEEIVITQFGMLLAVAEGWSVLLSPADNFLQPFRHHCFSRPDASSACSASERFRQAENPDCCRAQRGRRFGTLHTHS